MSAMPDPTGGFLSGFGAIAGPLGGALKGSGGASSSARSDGYLSAPWQQGHVVIAPAGGGLGGVLGYPSVAADMPGFGGSVATAEITRYAPLILLGALLWRFARR